MTSYTNHILIVDDNAPARELLVDLLSTDSYKLHQAEDGRKALQAIERHDPDLVLLDVMMPEMDGFQVCQQLRGNAKTADIPIIMLTALNDIDSRIRGFEAGADDFISKPYDRIELRTRIRGITRLNRYRRLVAEQEKFNAVVKHSSQATVIIDDDGNLQYANSAAKKLLLWTSDTLTIDEDFLQLAQRHFRLEPYMNWARWPSFQPDRDRKRFLVSRDKNSAELQWLQVNVVQHLPQDNQMVWILDIKDVSEYMAARRELWTVRSLMSERLMPPTASLVTSLDHLATATADQIDSRAFARIAKLSYQKARELYARMEKIVQNDDSDATITGKTIPLARVEALVSEVIMSFVESNEGKRALVNVRNQLSESDDSVDCSHEHLKKIFTELIENAIGHNPQKMPTVDITIRRAQVDQISFIISDDGPGIANYELDLVWQPYYQTRDTVKQGKTLGLGLTVVSTIVWEIGGHLTFGPGPNGVGTSATITLPVTRNQTGSRSSA